MEDAVGLPKGVETYGYTWGPDNAPGRPVVYIGPRPCLGLQGLLRAIPAERLLVNTNPYDAALGVEVLLHESVHQRGGVYDTFQAGDAFPNSFEGRTDCMALSLLPTYLPEFGVPATHLVSVSHSHRKAIRKHGRVVRWRRWLTFTTELRPNSYYTATMAMAAQQHAILAAAFPQYRGGCE